MSIRSASDFRVSSLIDLSMTTVSCYKLKVIKQYVNRFESFIKRRTFSFEKLFFF